MQEKILVDFKDLKLAFTKQTNQSSKLEGLFVETDNLKRLVNQYELKVLKIEDNQSEEIKKVEDKLSNTNQKIKHLKSLYDNKGNEEEKI